MLPPLSLLPPMMPLAPPEQARSTAKTLAQQSAQAVDHLRTYRQTLIATGEGVVLSVLAMEPDEVITEPFPPDSFLARPSAEDDYTATALLLRAGQRIDQLSALAATHQFRPIMVNGDGYEVEAFSQFAGFTKAVPFKAHYIEGNQSWRCIGGKISQRQGTVDKEFTVPTADLQLKRGLLGLRFQLGAGINETAETSTDHWMQSAEWESVDEDFSSATTLGALNGGRRAAGSLFVPLYAITDRPHLRAFPLGFQSITSTGAYWLRLIPSGISGTLLRP